LVSSRTYSLLEFFWKSTWVLLLINSNITVDLLKNRVFKSILSFVDCIFRVELKIERFNPYSIGFLSWFLLKKILFFCPVNFCQNLTKICHFFLTILQNCTKLSKIVQKLSKIVQKLSKIVQKLSKFFLNLSKIVQKFKNRFKFSAFLQTFSKAVKIS
jgi:hypothetical protein